jgi:CRISPR-associated protein Csy2
MSQYLVLSHIDVQNANAIAGLTWGFPAITQFLGFTHALNRKISNQFDGSYDIGLTGCAVVSHKVHNKVYQSKQYADFEFLQSKNPPVLAKHKSSSPPIIEEGKMNLTLSLVIELDKPLLLTIDEVRQLERQVLALCNAMRLAGGTVLNIKQVKLLSASTQKQQTDMLRIIKRLVMPGFVLLDRSNYLHEHHQTLLDRHSGGPESIPQLFDAWLDFSALKYQAQPHLKEGRCEPDENTPATWEYVAKPRPGYLVPLMTGYKAISKLYDSGEVLNTRDETTPSRFVEAIHSIGEWKGVHSIKDLDDITWRYQHDDQWYFCKQGQTPKVESIFEVENIPTTELNEPLNATDILNSL